MEHKTNGKLKISDDYPDDIENISADALAELLENLNARFKYCKPEEVLSWGYELFGQDMVVGTGFGPSGILLIDKIHTLKLPLSVFYLDTNLLFPETYQLKNEISRRFDIEIKAVTPVLSLKEQAENHGDELWKSDPDKCCYLRKVLPLKNYLSDKKAWVTGVRRSQTDTRKQTEIIEWDPENRVVKINPLADWASDDVWDYIHNRDLPYNPLHDHGYPTIGCIPCTKPADSEKDERSGRWANLEKTECGIHFPAQKFKNGK